MTPIQSSLRDPAAMKMPSAFRASPPIVAVLLAVGFATVSALVVIGTPSAGAETPAERCARETATYNSAWAQSWAASNGKPADQAPPPPVPYVCHDPGPPTSSTTAPPSVAAPTIPEETTPDASGPNMGAHAPTDIPDAGQTPIVPIPEREHNVPETPRSEPAQPDSTGRQRGRRLPMTSRNTADPDAGAPASGERSQGSDPGAEVARDPLGMSADMPPSGSGNAIAERLDEFRHNASFNECEPYEGGWFVSSRICASVDGEGLYVRTVSIYGERSGDSQGRGMEKTRIRYHLQAPNGENGREYEADLTHAGFHEEIEVNNYVLPGTYKVWYQTQDVNGNWSGWDSIDFEVKAT